MSSAADLLYDLGVRGYDCGPDEEDLDELAATKLKAINSHAFRGCVSLEKVTLENPQTEVARQAFADCPKLKDSPDPEAVQRRRGQKMIEEQLKQEEEYLRKESRSRLKTILRLFTQ